MFYNVDVAVDVLKSWEKTFLQTRISLLKISIAAQSNQGYIFFILAHVMNFYGQLIKRSHPLSLPSFPRHLNNLE